MKDSDLIRRSDAFAFQNDVEPLICKSPITGDVFSATKDTDLVEYLSHIPAVDAVEVRHGHWMTTDAFPHRVYCSECFKTYIPNDRWQIWQDVYGDGGLPRDYCPCCGARMDGRREDGTQCG